MFKLGVLVIPLAVARRNELWPKDHPDLKHITQKANHTTPSSHEALPNLELDEFPDSFTWCNRNGKTFCGPNKNQHIPQYCGSCWAFATSSALEDRIKIARKHAAGPDIMLAVQHILNCAGVGGCNGGEPGLVYQWLKNISEATGTGMSYESGLPYQACSQGSVDSKECIRGDWTCKSINIARTCGGHLSEEGPCVGLDHYPNATVVDHGEISGSHAMMRELYHRGPIACGVDANPILNYDGGISTVLSTETDHVVEVVGWNTDKEHGKYWIVRNSWGEYWGHFGFFYAKFGALNLGSYCAWAVPGVFSAPENHDGYNCHEDGGNCLASNHTQDDFLTIYS
jgi:cathepsin X